MEKTRNKVNPDTIDSLNYLIESLPQSLREKSVVDRIDMSWSEYIDKNKDLVSEEVRNMGRNIASKMIEDESDPVKKKMTEAVLKPFL